MMATSSNVLAEVKMLGLDENDGYQGGAARRRGVDNEQFDIESDQLVIAEISRMADRMSALLNDTRNINVETDERLRQIEISLSLISSEE